MPSGRTMPMAQHPWDIWALGTAIGAAEAKEPGYDHMPIIAAGLRMVADAIDPPSGVEARREIARDARPIDADAGRMGGSADGPKHGKGETRLARGSPAHAGIAPPCHAWSACSDATRLPRTRGDKAKGPGSTRGLSRSGPFRQAIRYVVHRDVRRHRVALGGGVRGGLGSDGVGVLYVRAERAQLRPPHPCAGRVRPPACREARRRRSVLASICICWSLA